MADQIQAQSQWSAQELRTFITAISVSRFATYLKAAGNNHQRALAIYKWNLDVSSLLFVVIQLAEIALRNAVGLSLEKRYGVAWHTNAAFMNSLTQSSRDQITQVKTNLARVRYPYAVGDVIANLSLGFWTHLMTKRHDVPIWNTNLANSLPNLPANVNRSIIQGRLEKIRILRNRIAHHEHLLGRNLLSDLGMILSTISWMAPSVNKLINYARIEAVIRSRP